MSELIAMRQRMKAIQTIKKVTHAMRLTAMSSHGKLKTHRGLLHEYKERLLELLSLILSEKPVLHESLLWPTTNNHNDLVILIGAQKGLCGNFNTSLFSFFERVLRNEQQEQLSFIAIGKKATDYLTQHNRSMVMSFTQLTPATILSIAQKVADHLWHARTPYSKVLIVYNQPKTFFAQSATLYQLIPFTETFAEKSLVEKTEAYHWEQDPAIVLDILLHRYLQCVFEDILFESLIAEQAARFIAMDGSTRNAKNLLETMRLDYNKLRQARITRELTDLIASF
jgi:F-type H+-transporting ATPase subunit gamma